MGRKWAPTRPVSNEVLDPERHSAFRVAHRADRGDWVVLRPTGEALYTFTDARDATAEAVELNNDVLRRRHWTDEQHYWGA